LRIIAEYFFCNSIANCQILCAAAGKWPQVHQTPQTPT
jgi:hypothetical protein